MTILKQLTISGTPSDGDAVTTSNTNFVGVSAGAGNTFSISTAAAMGAAYGIRANQAAANQVTSYLDLASPVTRLGWRKEFRYQATPAVSASILRFYPDTAHTANLGTLSITSSNRSQFVEGGSGSPLSVTSPSGSSLTPGSIYVEVGLIDVVANTFELRVYPFGSTSAVYTISGTLGADMAAASGVQSVRHGINTASVAMGNFDINSNFALGDDWVARTDVSNVAPTATLTANQSVSAAASVSITATASDSDGSIASYVWTGARYSPSAAPAALTPTSGAGTSTITYTSGGAGTLDVWTCQVSDNGGASSTATTEVRVGTSGEMLPLRGFPAVGVTISNVGGGASVGEAMGDSSDSTFGEWPLSTGAERAARVRYCPSQPRSAISGTWRLSKDTAGSLQVKVRLCQATVTDGSAVTVVKEWTYDPVTTAAADYVGSATSGELASVTDWGNVWFEFAEI